MIQFKLLLIIFLFICSSLFADGGRSEERLQIEGVPSILHLSGSPYELGFQHGQSLKEGISHNIKRLVEDKILANPEHPQIKSFLAMLPKVLEHVPKCYLEELKGLAEGAEVPYEKILILNLFPEMFHCTGMTVAGNATKEGDLYHVRVLDYAAGAGLQDTAVLMVVESEGKIPFINVSYAGFIGSVTGMNAQKIALGEIGGKGYGQYNGIPMAFLLRRILEEAGNLEEVKHILKDAQRTCEYYYVFSDGKDKQSMAVYATGRQLHFIKPGASYALFDANALKAEVPGSLDEKLVFDEAQIETSPYQTVLYHDQEKKSIFGLIHHQPADCLAITGFSNPQRYPILMERVLERYGKIDAAALQEIIKAPVARSGNLHNAIFAPATLDVWIAHAGPNGEPACDQAYRHYNLQMFLNKKSGSRS